MDDRLARFAFVRSFRSELRVPGVPRESATCGISGIVSSKTTRRDQHEHKRRNGESAKESRAVIERLKTNDTRSFRVFRVLSALEPARVSRLHRRFEWSFESSFDILLASGFYQRLADSRWGSRCIAKLPLSNSVLPCQVQGAVRRNMDDRLARFAFVRSFRSELRVPGVPRERAGLAGSRRRRRPDKTRRDQHEHKRRNGESAKKSRSVIGRSRTNDARSSRLARRVQKIGPR